MNSDHPFENVQHNHQLWGLETNNNSNILNMLLGVYQHLLALHVMPHIFKCQVYNELWIGDYFHLCQLEEGVCYSSPYS